MVLGDRAGLDGLVARYAWVKEIEAWTVAVIEGRTRDEVIRIYGGDPSSPAGDYLFSQMFDLQGNDPDSLKFHVQAIESGDHVVALENNGWSGSFPEIARRCSMNGGRFVSTHWDIHAKGMFTQAIDGNITAYFESFYPVAPEEPSQPAEIRPEWAIGPEVAVGQVWQTCLALIEQQTGLAIDPYWLGQQRSTYRIPEPYWLFRDVENAEQP